MSEFIWIYVYTVLDGLSTFSVASLWFGGVCLLIIGLTYAASFDDVFETGADYGKRISAMFKPFIFFMIICVLVSVLVPSKDDLKFIIGGGLAWKGIDAAKDIEGINELPENLVGAVNHFLKEIQEDKE